MHRFAFVIFAITLAAVSAAPGVIVAPAVHTVPIVPAATIQHHGAHAVHSHVIHHPAPVKTVLAPVVVKPVVYKPVVTHVVKPVVPVVPIVPVHHAHPAVLVHH